MDFFSMCSTRIGNAFSFFIFHDSFFGGIGKDPFNILKVRSGVSCRPVYIVWFLSVRFPLIDMRYSDIIS